MKRRSEVERLARTLHGIHFFPIEGPSDAAFDSLSPGAKAAWRRVAAFHLREMRRARGRTVGWVTLKTECDESGMDSWFEISGPMLDEPIPVRMTELMGRRVARVVLVEKRRKPR